MSSLLNTNIPPAIDITLDTLQPFQFTAVSQCTVCFATCPNFPPQISGKSIQMSQGQVLGPFNAPSIVTSCGWNCVPGFQPCSPVNKQGVGKTIHISSGSPKDKK